MNGRGGSGLRVGWVSPLPPQRSGIADYSARLAPAMAERLAARGGTLELLAEPGARPDPGLAARLPVRPLAELPAPAEGYDVLLYQLGNNPLFHGVGYRALLERPGIVVLHEVVLHHMIRELTLAAGDADGFVEAMRYAYGPTGGSLARRVIATGVPLDPYRYPLFERAVDCARAVVVHSRAARDRVLAARPAARVEVIPHFVELGEAAAAPERETARELLGIPPGALVVATFGYLTAAKRLDACLAAFARLRAERPGAVFLLAGEAEPRLDLPRRLAGEAGAGVIPLGHLPLDRFLAAMAATDLALNLRHPTGGETSGALMRLLALGKATVVTDAGAFAEIPDGCVAKVPPDALEADLLTATLTRLAADPALRAALGANARRWIAAHAALPVVAGAYAALIAEVAERDLRPAQAHPPVPPLAPYPAEDLLAELLRRAGGELADVGALEGEVRGEAGGEGDGDPLAGVARAIVELDLDRPPARRAPQ